MKINLYVSGRKLKDLDTFSKSDPCCVLAEASGNDWVTRGQTEQIMDSLNPDFRSFFTLEYYFEKVQRVKFKMIDGDGHGDYDTIGYCETTIGKIMGSKAQTFKAQLEHDGKKCGEIIIRAEAIQETNQAAQMTMSWSNVTNSIPGCLGLCPETVIYAIEI
jgi:hypothetical protein